MGALPGYSLYELYAQNDFTFPFWVEPWRRGRTIAKVVGFSSVVDRSGRGSEFVAHVWDTEVNRFLDDDFGNPRPHLMMNSNDGGWLPVSVDFQSN